MAWTDITKPAVGTTTKKVSFADAVIDDLNYLKSLVDAGGGGGGGANLVLNGGFETWTAGLPSGWSTDPPGQIYSGGSVNEETSDYSSGDKAMRINAPGAPGGAAVVSDYFVVSPARPVDVTALHKASVAGMWNRITLLWYQNNTGTVSAVSSSTIVYDSTANPTAYRIITGRPVSPPSDARYARMLVTGGVPGTVAGNAFFDDIIASTPFPVSYTEPLGIAELGSGASSYVDVGSVVLGLPTLSANSLVRITIRAWARGGGYFSDEGGEFWYYGHQRFRIGTSYSNENNFYSPGVNIAFTYVLLGVGLSGTQTLYQQLSRDTGAGFTFGRVDPFNIAWEVLRP